MRQQRTFSPEFKRQVVEELLSGVSTAAQLCRRHTLSSGLLYHWRKQYTRGGFGVAPAKEAALEERIRQLEQLLGQMTLENEFLKKAVRRSLAEAERNGRLLPTTVGCSRASKGGVHS